MLRIGFRVLRGKTKTEKYDEIKKYNNWGYSIAIEVKGATSNSQISPIFFDVVPIFTEDH